MEAIHAIVNEAATCINSEILQVVDGHLKYEQRRSDLKAKSEAELLESYNRREKIRIVGLSEEAGKDAHNRIFLNAIPQQSKKSSSWQRKQESKLRMMTFHLHIACPPRLVNQDRSSCVLPKG